MKSIFYLLLFVLSVSLFSCQDKEEPLSPLIGTWEVRDYVDSLDLWFVDSYKFKNDSVFDLTSLVRENEIGSTLGYRMTTTSWYNFEEGIFRYYYDDVLMYWGGESGPRYTDDLANLQPAIVDFFRVPKGPLTFAADFKSFDFQEECWQTNEGSDCIEFPVVTFIKVD